MTNNLNAEILDKLTKICPCKAISRSVVKEAIRNGATTVEEVSKLTGACTGSCNGFRCKSKVQDLINQHQNSDNL